MSEQELLQHGFPFFIGGVYVGVIIAVIATAIAGAIMDRDIHNFKRR